MEALLKAGLPAHFAAVISNNPDAKGLAMACSHGVATAVVDHRSFGDRAVFDAARQHGGTRTLRESGAVDSNQDASGVLGGYFSRVNREPSRNLATLVLATQYRAPRRRLHWRNWRQHCGICTAP